MAYSPKPQSRPQDGFRAPAPSLDTRGIILTRKEGEPLSPDLFDSVAHEAAKVIGENRFGNKASQIRQFYDELVMWEEKVRQNESRFNEYLPFIRMMNAKAAYAQGRKHVDANFTSLISHCLGQVKDADSLRNFKLFFEAFLGFYKLVNPQG